jgi:hypothetical protein
LPEDIDAVRRDDQDIPDDIQDEPFFLICHGCLAAG